MSRFSNHIRQVHNSITGRHGGDHHGGHNRNFGNSHFNHSASEHYYGGMSGNRWGGFGGRGGYYGGGYGYGAPGIYRGVGNGMANAGVFWQPAFVNNGYYGGYGYNRNYGAHVHYDATRGRGGYQEQEEVEYSRLQKDAYFGRDKNASEAQRSLGRFAENALGLEGRDYSQAEELATALNETARGRDFSNKSMWNPTSWNDQPYPRIVSNSVSDRKETIEAIAHAIESTNGDRRAMKDLEELWRSGSRVPAGPQRNEYLRDAMENFAAGNGHGRGYSNDPYIGQQYEQAPRQQVRYVPSVPSAPAANPAEIQAPYNKDAAIEEATRTGKAADGRTYMPSGSAYRPKTTSAVTEPNEKNLFGAADLFDGQKANDRDFVARAADYLASQNVDQAKITDIKARLNAAGEVGLSDATSATLVHSLRNAINKQDKDAVNDLLAAVDAVSQSLSGGGAIEGGVSAQNVAAIQAARDYANGRS